MQYLNELNKNQYKAVTSNKKKILVLAGAGSGKTKTLTSRIRYLTDNNVAENQIIAFTFTNKAANEMKLRLKQSLNRDHEVSISTFHSYAMKDFSYYGKKYGYENKIIVLTDEQRSKILRKVLNEFGLNTRSNYKYFKYISKIKNNTPLLELSLEESLLVNQIYHRYQELLLEYQALDFDDMIPLFLKFLRSNDEYAHQLKENAKYILVDECQDTNPIQYELIYELASINQNIFMVGDDDQLIYSFRNSNKELMDKFQTQADELIILNENYRCAKNILDVSNNLIINNTKRIDKKLFSAIDSIARVRYAEFNDSYEEAKRVSELISVLLKKGYNPKDIAILYRNNNQAFPMEKELTEAKIPYITFSEKSLLENEEIILIVSIYRFLLNQNDILSFEKICINPIDGIEQYILTNFLNNRNKNKPIIEELLSSKILKLQALGNKLNNLLKLITELNNEEFFNKLIKEFKYREYLKNTSDKIIKHNRINTLKAYIIKTPLNELLDLFNNLTIEEDKSNNKNNYVSLLTIHKTKGLEFKCVIIIGCNEGIIPPLNISKEAKDEERRCLYVAITRAQEILYITSAITHTINGRNIKYQKSSFLKETGILGTPIKTKYYENN